VSDEQGKGQAGSSAAASPNPNATVIKKYANRRLYNTATSTYVTLEDLAQMVRAGTDFIVYDAKTGEDITRSVLTQIIFEEENKGGTGNLLPINFLRQLIRFYGDSMQGIVPNYLEMSLDSLTREQDKFRKQMGDAFGGEVLKGMEEQTRRNMQMFQDAMKMFNPFAAAMGGGMPGMPGAESPKPKPEAAAPSASNDDLKSLKDQLSQMQAKLDSLANKN
jgi:polyhydroxyalkanoate synthesis repressor PhaR